MTSIVRLECCFGLVAQLVEQRIENPRVGGSIPPQATKHIRPTLIGRAFLFVKVPNYAGRTPFLRVPPLFARAANPAPFASLLLSSISKPRQTARQQHTQKPLNINDLDVR
jgi:hypothetical protein